MLRPNQRKRDMRFTAWKIRSLYRAGSLRVAPREIARLKLDLVDVQEDRWGKRGTVRAAHFNFFYEKGNEDHKLGAGFCVHRRILSAVKREEFLSDRMSYRVMRGRWCNIIVLNVYATSEENNDDSKDSLYEELQ